ncbi:MAG: PilZ domain-containing protein [Chromatiales bacterium]|jgi:hypothetical protein
MTEYAEKRHFRRMGIDCPAQFRIQSTEEMTEAIVKNLSASGLLILAPQEINPGTRLLVHIVPMNTITPPLSATANVIRTTPADDGGYEIACTIEKILGEEEEEASDFTWGG